ncbi:nucleobase:cation symporter-2 family protein [Sinobaca sp. H24]|uniref:nucleobase:cation symporter-2 family protein n=1 Tax=Sinobaca sp. H24 TaxID=2923376 RepID=UPI002079E806|nr:nucleobase:cation symporter-2 family protein [Sinobaca sp. H24]
MRTFTLGMQHVLAMFAGAILVPILLSQALNLTSEQTAYLIAIDLFTCGVATILQSWKTKYTGIGLPAVLGASVVAAGPMIAIGGEYGMTAIYGSILVSGLIVVLFAKYLSHVIHFFPPVVTGTVITLIGLTLLPVGINNMAGGTGSENFGSLNNVLLGLGVLALILVLQSFFKGPLRSLSILIGLVAGTIFVAVRGNINFSEVAGASWVSMPQPFYFGMPMFELGAIIPMLIVTLIILFESTGVFLALGKVCDEKVEAADLERGYRAEGFAFLVGGLFNGFAYNTFAQNVGLVQLSRVKTVAVTFTAGFILIALGLTPKIAALIKLIPPPALGAAMVVLFGMVAVSGIRMLTQVDLENNQNVLVISVALGLGLGTTIVPELFAQMPEQISFLFHDGIITGSLAAIGLHLLNVTKEVFACRFREQTTFKRSLKMTLKENNEHA